MGRRAYSPKERRRNSLQCYLTDAEYHRVGRVATKQDKHLSAWFREVILRECKEAEGKSSA